MQVLFWVILVLSAFAAISSISLYVIYCFFSTKPCPCGCSTRVPKTDGGGNATTYIPELHTVITRSGFDTPKFDIIRKYYEGDHIHKFCEDNNLPIKDGPPRRKLKIYRLYF
jgi:hypothetical protein